MKAAAIHTAFARAGIPHALVHTGQHYDEAMSKVFFEDLGMPRPAVDLGVGSGTHAEQTRAGMVGLERYFEREPPAAVLVVGDVNSTMAAAIVCAKLGIYCGHVEAGLRSGDWSMPEEGNRGVTDSVVDLLLTPAPEADRNLLAEGCPAESIVRVGNVMIDTDAGRGLPGGEHRAGRQRHDRHLAGASAASARARRGGALRAAAAGLRGADFAPAFERGRPGDPGADSRRDRRDRAAASRGLPGAPAYTETDRRGGPANEGRGRQGADPMRAARLPGVSLANVGRAPGGGWLGRAARGEHGAGHSVPDPAR